MDDLTRRKLREGHRQRIRRRLLDHGTGSLEDYELLEALLFLAQPRGDTRATARLLLKRFGTLSAVFAAEAKRLEEVEGIGETSLAALRLVREVAQRLAREQVLDRPVLSSWKALLDYCRVILAEQAREQFHLLFLDGRNRLIADEVQQQGTIDHTPVYPREVARRALELQASAVILVHNHPSGDPTPSREDIAMTGTVRDALKPLGIAAHDHLIIGRTGHASFKSLGLL
ncbi:MAG: DNA repair protein RadC [Alphaproteobacteria bacterium]|nr:DNA repair protein RadC [Alphaproteobacteria bacterium]